MSLTQEQIARLGKLTALHPKESLNISTVLDSFDSLQNTDTSHIDGVRRSGQGALVPREDIVVDAGIADALLGCTHQRVAAHQIVLGGIMVGE